MSTMKSVVIDEDVAAVATSAAAGERSVLLLITTLTFGGAETQVVRLAVELQQLGWRVAVVCMVDPTNYVSILEGAGIPVYSLKMPRGIPDPRGIFRLAALIRKIKPDVLHSHMVHANLLGRFSRLFAPVPVVISTVHNFRETSEKGGPTWYKELLYRLTDPLADRTTVISESAFERYVRVRAVPRSKFEMLPNGVDTMHFIPSAALRDSARAERGLGQDFVWLAIGRLVAQKDYPNLLRAVKQLPVTGWQLLIVGQGDLEESLLRLTAELKIDDKVRFVPAREDVLSFYSCADAFVMSSEFEGMSAALQEAIAMALPCVVTDVGANRDLVIDGVTGHLVPPGNSNALASAMRDLMSASISKREAFGRKAREFAISKYEFRTVARRWVELYMRFCRAKSGRRA